jgi:DNA-directed RNA polymerase subunit M/transcription elongation factor TFIIS
VLKQRRLDEPVYFFECTICGFDSTEAKRLSHASTGNCPLCYDDCIHIVPMKFRLATEDEQAKL